MNTVGVARNLTYIYKDDMPLLKRLDRWIPFIFGTIMAIMGILSWTAWYSIFIWLGLVINTVCLALPYAQWIRYSILITSPLVLTYDLFVPSYAGALSEGISVLSAAIGVFRFRKQADREEPKTC